MLHISEWVREPEYLHILKILNALDGRGLTDLALRHGLRGRRALFIERAHTRTAARVSQRTWPLLSS